MTSESGIEVRSDEWGGWVAFVNGHILRNQQLAVRVFRTEQEARKAAQRSLARRIRWAVAR